MRWPFSRRGSESTAPEGVTDVSRTPAAEPAAAPASAPSAPTPAPAPVQRRAEWATLPPIQRAAQDIELTAESALFVENLASNNAVEPTLQPLGHDVTMEAPAGIASGIARPVSHHHTHSTPLQHRLRPVPAPAPAARPVQRSTWPSIHPPSAPPAPAPMELARHADHEEEAATMPAEVEQVSTMPAEVEQVSTVPAAEAPVQRAPAQAPTPSSSSSPSAPAPVPGQSPVARHATGEPHVDEVATSPAPDAPEPPCSARRDEDESAPQEEEEAATMPAVEGVVQRAADEPAAAPTVGARPVVAARVFRSSLGSLPPQVGLQGGGGPLSFAAAQRAQEAGASAPAAGVPFFGPVQAAPSAPSAHDIATAAAASASATPVARHATGAAHEDEVATTPQGVAPKPAESAQRASFDDAPRAPGMQQSGEIQRSAAAPSSPAAPQSARRPAAAGSASARRSKGPIAATAAASRPRESPSAVLPPRVPFRSARSGAPARPSVCREHRSTCRTSFPPRRVRRTVRPRPRSPLRSPAPRSRSLRRRQGRRLPRSVRPPTRPTLRSSWPRARTSSVRRAFPADLPDFEVQRAPEAAPAVGFDAFVAHASAVSAGRTPEGADPGGGDFGPVQRSPENVDFAAPAGVLAPRLDLPHRKRSIGSSGSRPGPGPASGATTSQATSVQRASAQASTPPVLALVGKRALQAQVQRSSEDVPAAIR